MNRLRLKDLLGTGAGEVNIPFDQSVDPTMGVELGAGGGPPSAGVAPTDPAGLLPPSSTQPTTGLSALGTTLGDDSLAPESGMALPSTDAMSDVDLAGMDPSVLDDPSLSPQDKAILEQELLLAAKRGYLG